VKEIEGIWNLGIKITGLGGRSSKKATAAVG